MLLAFVVLIVVSSKAQEPFCKKWKKTELPVFSKDGDIIIGGIFSLHDSPIDVNLSFNEVPEDSRCKILNYSELQCAQTFIFAVGEINNRTDILPGISLGYKIYDTCRDVRVALKMAMALLSGSEEELRDNKPCAKSSNVLAIIGQQNSSPVMGVATALGPFNMPVISHGASCVCLSNKNLYPTFLRTVPSDYYQSKALVWLVKHFGWTWVGALRSDTDYGNYGMAGFLQMAQQEGICIEYSEAVYRTYPKEKFLKVVDTIKRSTSKVIVTFITFSDLEYLLVDLLRYNVTGYQWIGTESWMSNRNPLYNEHYKLLNGAIGTSLKNSFIPGWKDFLVNVRPSDITGNTGTNEFWEFFFNCSLSNQDNVFGLPKCTGSEDLKEINNPYTDLSNNGFCGNAYTATYGVAYALHNLLGCQHLETTLANKACSKNMMIEPNQVLSYLKNVTFTTNEGDSFYFDKNGDPTLQGKTYDLINWQLNKEGMIEFVAVGAHYAFLPDEQQFVVDYDRIVWAGESKQVPKSVCSETCQPGTRKAVRKGQPACCFDCISCAEGEISNTTDSTDCLKCPLEYMANKQKVMCILKDIEFLSFEENMGILLVTLALLGASLTIAIAFVFYLRRDTPIVKANNSELSFLLLFSLMLCFLCSLTFIGQPTDWSCMLRHTAFGITFVLCISCVLGKTIVVLMAFRATLPGNNVMKWFGGTQQRLSVCILTLIQVVICLFWILISPPFPNKNFKHYSEIIILECDLGSKTAFYAVLGYIGLLAALCFVLAFLGRKLPDNFNEAKFITFSILIFCAVWITFIPAYISSPGKYTVAVEIFAILASSFGLFFCIFIPKCFVILFKPEQNTKKHLMGKAASKSL